MRALKQVLWDTLQKMHATCRQDVSTSSEQELLPFQDVVAAIAPNNAAGRLEDISVHLCFICLLHLANEHGLCVTGAPSLDSLHISHVPAT